MTGSLSAPTVGRLGLDRLVRRLVTEDGFADRESAYRAIAHYERFFFAACHHHEPLVPPAAVDLVWQRHMLDTLAYQQDCLRWANRYLHRDQGAPDGAFARCVRLLGGAAEEEWDRPSRVHVHGGSMPADGADGRSRTFLHEADLSAVLSSVERSMQHKPPALPWVSDALEILRSDPALAVEEYRRFLQLMVEEPGALTPCKLVDEFWYQHILDSRAYFSFCVDVAGRYLHHVPKARGKHEPGFLQTQALYKKHFASDPPPALWRHMGDSAICRDEPLYTKSDDWQMEASLRAGAVDAQHRSEFHPVLDHLGLPVETWKNLVAQVDAVPRMPWTDWRQGLVMRDYHRICGLVLAVVLGALIVGFAVDEGLGSARGIVSLIFILNALLVGWLCWPPDPRQVQRVVRDFAPVLAEHGVVLKADDKCSYVVVSASRR